MEGTLLIIFVMWLQINNIIAIPEGTAAGVFAEFTADTGGGGWNYDDYAWYKAWMEHGDVDELYRDFVQPELEQTTLSDTRRMVHDMLKNIVSKE